MPRPVPEDLALPLRRHQLGDQEVWVSADGRWAVLPTPDLEALLGARVPSPVSHGPALGPLLQGPAAEEELPTVVGQVPSTDSAWAATDSGSNARYWMTSTALLILSAVLLMLALGIRIRRDHPEILSTLGITTAPDATATSPTAAPPPPAPVEPTPAPEAAPVPEAPKVPVQTSTPTPTPAPKPAPRPSAGSSVAAAIAAGWESVEHRPASAEVSFRDALARQPGNHEAQYGLGYALLKRGDREGAARYLCSARGGPSEVSREAAGLLATHELSCR